MSKTISNTTPIAQSMEQDEIYILKGGQYVV